MNRHEKAFTLIELLIVVAIIAILAAIAVPNFLEAQVRSKVSRVHSDLRTLATAFETYAVDWRRYPCGEKYLPSIIPPWKDNWGVLPIRLTTPIAYITTRPFDPFVAYAKLPGSGGFPVEREWKTLYRTTQRFTMTGEINADWVNYYEKSFPDYTTRLYIISSFGPDRDGDIVPHYVANPPLYDSTNGTISDGDVVRVGP